MSSSIVGDGTVPWLGTGIFRHSRIPVTSSAVGIRRSRSAVSEKPKHMRDWDRSNDRTSRSVAFGNRPVYTGTGELEIEKKHGRKVKGMLRPKLTTARPFSVESSPSSLSSSAVEEPMSPPPVDERLNAAMEKLFELYRRQERRGSLGGSDTDASLSGGGRGMGGGADVTEATTTSGRVRSRSKRRIPVRRSKSSLFDTSKSSAHDSVKPSAVYSQTTPKDEDPDFDRLSTTQQRHNRYVGSPVRGRRVATYEDHRRVARKFVPPKATGVVLGSRSRSCGLTRYESLKEASSSRFPDAVTRAHPRTRSNESFWSTGHGQKHGTDRNRRDASGTERGTSRNRASSEPHRSRYESHRMRNGVADIPKANDVNHDVIETMLKSDRHESRRNQTQEQLRKNQTQEQLRRNQTQEQLQKNQTQQQLRRNQTQEQLRKNQTQELRSSTSTRDRYRSDETLNRESFRSRQRGEELRKATRPTGSMSKIPSATMFTGTKKALAGTEQSGSGSDSDREQVRSRLPVRRSQPEESIGHPLDPGTILISNRSLWFVDRRHRSHPPKLEQVALPVGLDHLVRSIMLKHLLKPKSSGNHSSNDYENNDISNDSNSRNVSSTGQ